VGVVVVSLIIIGAVVASEDCCWLDKGQSMVKLESTGGLNLADFRHTESRQRVGTSFIEKSNLEIVLK
jgi:hypothetical protein